MRGWSGANLDLQLNERAYVAHFAGSVIDKETGKSLEYRDLMKLPKYKDTWSTSLANEFGRLAQGIRNVPSNDTIFFIQIRDPQGQAQRSHLRKDRSSLQTKQAGTKPIQTDSRRQSSHLYL